MAKINVNGNSMTVKSALTLEDIKTAATYAPKALRLYCEDTKEEIFSVTVGEHSSVGTYGVTFNAESRNDKKAMATVTIPEGIEDAKAYVKDNYTQIILNLQAVEKQVTEAGEKIKADKESVDELISIGD